MGESSLLSRRKTKQTKIKELQNKLGNHIKVCCLGSLSIIQSFLRAVNLINTLTFIHKTGLITLTICN